MSTYAGGPAEPSERSGHLVARNFLALGSGEALGRVLAFIATIYIARVLGAASYGAIALASAIVLYFSRIVDGGLDLGLGVREMAAAPERLQELAPSVLTARMLVAIPCIAVLVFAGWFVLPESEGRVLAIYSLTLLAVGASTRWIHLGLEKARPPGVTKAVGELAMALLVFAVVHAPGDLELVPMAQVVGDMLAAGLLLAWTRRYGLRLRWELRPDVLRPLVRRAWPLVASGLLGLMIYNSDLIFLRLFRSSDQVGYYAAAYTLISFTANLGIAYRLALLPTLTRLTEHSERKIALFDSANAHVTAVGLPLAFGSSILAAPIIGLVFGKEYVSAGSALAVLAWSVPAGLLRGVSIAALLSRGREARVLRITASAAGTNLILNLLLIPRFGILGAAWATLATETLAMVLAIALASAEGFRPTGGRRYWRSILASGAMGGVLVLARPESLITAVPLGVASYVIFLLILGGLRFRRAGFPTVEV